MLTCLENKIWVVWLPAHSSHLSQPLDVNVFTTLKRKYRALTDDLAILTDADNLTKEDFLAYYRQARKQALTIRNGRSGWQATGLWPVQPEKILNHPMVQKAAKISSNTLGVIKPSTPIKGVPLLLLQTPQGGLDIRKQAIILKKHHSPTKRSKRLFIRKLNKGMNKKNIQIANLERKIKYLEIVIRRLRPKKRAKVIPDNNKYFVGMKEAKKTMKKVEAAQQQKNNLLDVKFHGFD